ncbi:NfeD family protein [Xanthobacter sp. TB0139]|uniref:NfeD family protein n=1 Tax=Xanthobacter sp. TB0139 TaxID=3459178 RepID=UPI0040392E47
MPDTSFLAELGPWGWFVLGGILLVAEIFAPGAFLLWLGLAAFIIGTMTAFLDLAWQAQVVAFAALSIISVLVGRSITPPPGKASDKPFLNRRAESYVGRIYVLEEPMSGGVGHIRIGDTMWRVEGPDLMVGSRVRVVAAEGVILKVEAA